MNIIATYNIFILPKPQKKKRVHTTRPFCQLITIIFLPLWHLLHKKRISFLHFNNKNKKYLKIPIIKVGGKNAK
jgi:hypothetical protein